MARSIQEIFDSMITEKETKATLSGLLPLGTNFQNLLDDITTGSKVGLWRLWLYMNAFAINILETFFDKFKADVEVIKSKSIFGTEAWWIDRMFEFQIGYTVEIIDIDGVSTIGYANIDQVAKITSAAAISSSGGVSTIKVAKDDGSGGLEAFDNAEITSINSYRDKLQPAGATISVISLNADLCKIFADIFYDAQLDQSVVQTNVELAINDYFKNLDFGGIVNVNSLIDEIQLVDGINDIKINSFDAKPNGGVYAPINREYETSSGYIVVDGGFNLSTTLIYTAQ